jgi:hypothetical protein
MCVDPAVLLRVDEVYETDRIDFAEAYLVACTESTGRWQGRFLRQLSRSGQHFEGVEPPRV